MLLNVILISDTLRGVTQKNEYLTVSHFYKAVSQTSTAYEQTSFFEFQTLITYPKTFLKT